MTDRRERVTPRRDCHERALGLLAVRPRSRRELERRLLRAGFEAGEVTESLDRLERVGLVDDEAFARQLAEQAFGARKAGRRAVAGALAAKGVDTHIAGAVLDELGGDDRERADELASDRARRLADLPPEVAFRRLSGFLMRRGHAPDVAMQAARAALALERPLDG